MPKTHVEMSTTTSTPTTAPSPSEALPPALRELLGIFAQELAAVSFPNVDHKVLVELAEQVEVEAQRVEELRAQLDTAHAGLIDVKARLQRAAEQGLAYARVYAAGDADLAARLAEVNLGGETPRRRKLEVAAAAADPGDGTTPIKLPAKRGRKPKQQPVVEDETGS
jgi:hypothetical protein